MLPTTTLEADGKVGADDDDLPFALKLADNLEARVRVLYLNDAGELSDREIVIDGLYGDSLDHPRYMRALDGKSAERRTFRTDRVLAICEGARWIKAAPHMFGDLAREARAKAAGAREFAGLKAVDLSPNLPLLIEDQDAAGSVRMWDAILRRFLVKHSTAGLEAIVFFELCPRGATAPRKLARYIIEPPGVSERTLTAVYDPATGEAVDDLYGYVTGANGSVG